MSTHTCKTYRYGTDRLVDPEETLERVRPAMHTMGITRLANITGLDTIGIPVVMACRPNSRSLSVTQGKGVTMNAAKTSALMEAVESYHADHITLPLKLGSFEDLQDVMPLIDIAKLPTDNGAPFVTDRPQLWIEGYCLLSEQPLWVPFDMVHCDFTYASRLGRSMFDITSNGLASGNHLLEAISHAICEIVERDATALWLQSSAKKRRATRIVLDTVNDAACCEVLARLAKAHLHVGVWEVTSDVELPAFFCTIADESGISWQTLYASQGMGCHPRREIALLRALTEAVQSRLTAIAGSRDDIFRFDYERMRNPQVLDESKKMITEEIPERSFDEAPTFDHSCFDEDVALELNHLRSLGVSQIVVIDLTKPEIGVPVVRVVIPGLEFYVKSTQYHPGPRARQFTEVQA